MVEFSTDVSVFIITIVLCVLLVQFISGYTGEKQKNTAISHRVQSQLPRRLQHMITGLAFVAISCSKRLNWEQEVVVLFICSICFYSIHRFRLIFPQLNTFLVAQYASILREDEANGNVPGAFFFLLGASVCCSTLSFHIFNLSILFLAIGDPIAAMVGIGWKEYVNNNGTVVDQGKSMAGTVAACTGCTLVSLIYFHLFQCTIGVERLVLLGLIGGLSERISVFGMDDNFSLPVIAGGLISATMDFSYCPTEINVNDN